MALHKLYGGEVSLNFDGRRHVYTWNEQITADGTPLKIAGVTSILGFAAKEALIPWAAKMAASYFEDVLLNGEDRTNPETSVTWSVAEIEQISHDASKNYMRKAKEAADVGSAVHAYAEARLKGDKVPDKPKKAFNAEDMERYRNGCRAFDQWFNSHRIELLAAEKVIFSRRWMYAGTCDFYGYIDGELCVLDFKTSSGLYPEMALQVAAYQIALEEEMGVAIPVRWLVRFDKASGECHTIRLPRNREHEEAFLALREFAAAMTRMKRNWTVI